MSGLFAVLDAAFSLGLAAAILFLAAAGASFLLAWLNAGRSR